MKKYDYLRVAILLLLVEFAQGEFWNVSQNMSIQDALQKASPGDTILVKAGTYSENLNISKPLVLKGVEMPVVDGRGKGWTITLSTDGIVLEGFVATNSGKFSEAEGIKIISNNNIIRNNTIKNCSLGMTLLNSTNNTIKANRLTNNRNGILLSTSHRNSIMNNDVNNNQNYGVYLNISNYNIIKNNNVTSNKKFGMIFNNSSNNIISANSASNNNLCGISIDKSDNNEVSANFALHEKNGICINKSNIINFSKS